jgi:cytochrome c oxidase cbb3-type subunit 3
MSTEPKKTEGQVETTGHVWDENLEEYNNPLPRWWLWVFYLTIIWGIGYTIAYPAWPLIHGATPGLLGFSTRAQVAEEIKEVEVANAPIESKLASVPLTEISADPELNQFAENAGKAVFNTWCMQCHGVEGQGAVGYPTLSDDDWLWGGDIEAIYATVTHGIRNETDPEARFSQMPAFGEILSPEEIVQVVNYVRKISNQENDAALATAGEQVFLDNCAACHGDDGKGMRDLGAPNLTDAIWLYGGDEATLIETVTNARFGVMPNWNTRLSEADIRAVTTYVHGLGGGEATPVMQ